MRRVGELWPIDIYTEDARELVEKANETYAQWWVSGSVPVMWKNWKIRRIFKEDRGNRVKTDTFLEEYLENPEVLFEAELHKNRDTVLSFRLKGFAHEISARSQRKHLRATSLDVK